MADALRVFSVIELFGVIILAIITSQYQRPCRWTGRMVDAFDGVNFFTWLVIGIVVFIFINAFAEIIQILHDIRNNTGKQK